MPTRTAGVNDLASGASVVEVEVVERASPDLTTTTTADPGAGGTSLAVTARDKFPQAGQFKMRVEAEVMYVTAGWGIGAGNYTVVRGQDGTTAVAHSTGVIAAQVTAVQRVEPVAASRQTTFLGRAATFRTPGRAGTTGQKVFAIHNATGSGVLINIKKLTVDIAQTVVKAVTVLPPTIRLWRFTAVPTLGTALPKVAEDTSLTSNAAVTLWQDASADGTSSASALTVTLPASNIMAGIFAPRLITAAGAELFDTHTFLEAVDDAITLRALQGVAIFLDYTAAGQNPTTDMWAVGVEWEEFTPA